MKLFFLASISANTKLRDDFRLIIRLSEECGNIVQYLHVFEKPTKVQSISPDQLEKRARELVSEAVIFEGTHSSTGAGYLLSIALQRSIPTLFLTQKNYSGLYVADPNRLLMIKQYNPTDEKSTKKIISNFLSFSKKKRLKNRFNFMISDSMNDFMNKKSSKLSISKADYLRNLV